MQTAAKKPAYWRDLTKPQVAQMTRALRSDGAIFPNKRSVTRVLSNLSDKGLLDGGFNEGFYLNQAGLKVLRDYRAVQYANDGSMASMRDLEQVEVALQAEAA